MIKNKRTVRGMITNPKQQTRFSLTVLGTLFAFLAMYIVATGITLSKIVAEVASAYGLSQEGMIAIDGVFTHAIVFLIISAVVITGASIYMCIQISHRFYGPMVPIMRHLQRLNEGDFSQRLKLRSSDEGQFLELETALNSLTDKLAKK